MALTEEDKEQLYGEVENKGFGYWIQNYGFKDIDKDPKLVELCLNAREAMNKLEKYMEDEEILD